MSQKPREQDADRDHPIYDAPGHLIRRLQQIAVAIFMSETEGFDITPVQYAALLAIELNPGMDQTSLVKSIAFDRSTIGDVVTRLESRMLIKRAPGPVDRRTKLLYITRAGRRLVRDIESGVHAAQRRIMAPLRPRERTTFLRMVRRLVQSNNEHSRAPLNLTEGRPRRRSIAARLLQEG